MFDIDDDKQTYQRDTPSWILIIFVGVFLANLATLTVIKLYLNYEVEQLETELKKQTLKLNESMRIQQMQQKEANRKRQNDAVNRSIQIKKNNDLCQFWIKEVAKNSSVRNQELKRRACSR